jgi:putative flippase GtrA
MWSGQFRDFLLAGALAAAANFASRFLFSRWVRYEWAVLMAFCVGLIVGFVLMRTYVFHARDGAILGQSIKFLGVNLLAAAQTLVISVALAKWALPAIGLAAHAEALGHLAGVCAPIITSYFGHRLLTFR